MSKRAAGWIVVTTLAACGAPTPIEPITGTAPTAKVQRPAPTPLPVSAGKERIHFEPNTVGMSAAEAAVLHAVVQRLGADPALNLQISGHTDSTELGAHDTSVASLSHQRAQAVRNYLLARGIAASRLLIRAVGATEPRHTNATREGRAANRRVELETVTITIEPFGGRVVVTQTDVEILDRVTFEPGKDVLAATSLPALDAVASTLHGNPSILLVEVQGHTDERGDDAVNLRLSSARALVVVSYLLGKGVDPSRLVAQGYGETQPLDASHTEAAWTKNQRIAFLILKRAP